jgi:hypothetical protein
MALRALRILAAAWAAIVLSAGARPEAPVGAYQHLCTLIALPWDAFTHVPAAEVPPMAADGGATFQTSYTGFTVPAHAAFQHAANQWAGLVSSPIPIRIMAEFKSMGTGVLAAAGTTCLGANFSGASFTDTWYPDALTDRLTGTQSNCGSAEITVQLNNTVNWYYGTDGRPGSGQYDFVTVVGHEIAHGLGFYGSASVTNGQGSYGYQGFPDVYDRFVVTETGAPVLAAFVNPSGELGTQLSHSYAVGNVRGPGVYFSGSATNAANGGLSVRLYTNTTWQAGSSYSHLDENTYPAGHADSLMTYALAAAEAIHHPGNVPLGMFKDMGWSTCPASLSATSAIVAAGVSSGSVALTIEPNCAWSAATASSFVTLTGAASGMGSGTVSYQVAANATGSPRQGTIRASGVTFTISQSANANAIALSPSTLRFAGTNNGGTLSPMTVPQTVTVTASGAGPITWAAAANQPWVQITGGSGTGSGTFTVGMINPDNVLGATTRATATITVTSANAGNSPRTIAVTLSLTSALGAPFGQVDAPAQHATDVVGAIGITGWALDDVAVTRVKVYRTCLGMDDPNSCQVILGRNVVWIGDAAFLPGARPDVEAAFPTVPNAHAAGWGMQILTNMLPSIPNGPDGPNGQLYGGQGAVTLYAFAFDVEGRVVLLGRSSDPASPDVATPTVITLGNDAIAQPFGTIDTPALGATVSGTIANFGWVLTPDANTAGGDALDIQMAPSGSGMVVYIDGLATATVAYNQCRGTVGNPPPPGVYCDDDIANIFGNTTPQAPLTSRTANQTRYRNLDATRSAIGAYVLDTTTLTNGLHTIAWGVADSAGRGEGIGSRFFTVFNSGADAPLSAACSVRGAACSVSSARRASALAEVPIASGAVYARTGFQLGAPWQELRADADGVRHARIPEMGRIELAFDDNVDHAYLVANGTLRDLPVGSTLQARGFAWAPGPGYLGPYTLAFLRGDARTDVLVTVGTVDVTDTAAVRMHVDKAVQSAGVPSAQRLMRVEGPALSPSTSLGAGERSVRVEGWALDPLAGLGSGVGAVHVWARRVQGPESRVPGAASPVFLGSAQLDLSRPDVATAHGAPFHHAGFALQSTVALPPGDYEITAYVWLERTGRWEDARTVRLTIR